MARKTWVLDTDTKGTGANMVPLEKTLKEPERSAGQQARGAPNASQRQGARPAQHGERMGRPTPPPVKKTATPLPAGHVRKRATGEIGKVQAIDAKAGTATVRWLKRGLVSTVPLSAVSRR